MLPPNDYEDNEGGYPFDREDYNREVFDTYGEAKEAYDAISEYMHNSGYSNDEWFSMMRLWVKDEDDGGYYFEWESDGGSFGGKGHT